MRALRALSSLLLLAACDGSSNPGVRIELVDPSGDNAALDVIEGSLAVQVRQGDTSLCTEGCSTVISGGDFELTLPIESFVDLTRLQGHIIGGPVETWGAVPPFAIAGEFLETAELPVRLVMMAPGTCEPLTLFNVSTAGRPRLVEPRRDMAVAIRRNFALLAGGRGDAGGSNRADFFDQIVVEMRPPLDSPSGPLGPSRGLTLSEDASLVVGETTWVYERQVQGPPAPAQVTVHEGAGFASALALVNNTAAVIGGTDTDQVSWFTARTPFPATTLTTPRAFPAAAAGAEGVLVVGGGPGAEWITITGAPVFIDGVPDSVGGWVTASPSGQTFLAIGGSGAVTTLFRGCPACVAEPGPTWTRARDGASAVRTEAGVLWIVGGDDSREVDLVRWETRDGVETPFIVDGPQLSVARAGAAVAEHASGVVFVVGGENAEGMLAEAELCTPAEGLDPLN